MDRVMSPTQKEYGSKTIEATDVKMSVGDIP